VFKSVGVPGRRQGALPPTVNVTSFEAALAPDAFKAKRRT
jgi:hypothetical protein